MINLDCLTYAKNFITKNQMASYKSKIEKIKGILSKKESMLDWYDLSTTVSKEEIAQILEYSKFIKNNCDTFVVVGIGGSYLGAKAVIDIFAPLFKESNPKIIFAGTSLSPDYLNELLEYLKNKDFCLNIISKSGTTMETTISSDILLNLLKQKYPKDFQKRVIITTDKNKGSLRELCNKEQYKSLVVPDQIGGRYSVLTPVGLLPICVSGVDIKALLKGYDNGKKYIDLACEYAIARNLLLNKNYFVEALTTYEPKLNSFNYWIQQLFAESLGKNKSGILPLPNPNTTNLHSIGQYLQDGTNIVFETVLKIKNLSDVKIDNNKSLKNLQDIVINQVALAHELGDTPSFIIEIEKLSPENIGELIYFYFITSAVCGYLQNVNPFNQDGVEEYKKLVKEEIKKLNF